MNKMDKFVIIYVVLISITLCIYLCNLHKELHFIDIRLKYLEKLIYDNGEDPRIEIS